MIQKKGRGGKETKRVHQKKTPKGCGGEESRKRPSKSPPQKGAKHGECSRAIEQRVIKQ